MNSIKAIGGSAAFGAIQQTLALTDDDGGLPPVAEDEEQLTDNTKGKGNEIDAPKGNEIDPPQKEKLKHIKKKFINRQYIKRMLRHINKNIKREHTIANPKN
eukprot:TRINITY_DN2145_c0_g1_i1.p2 TRINITY_DN2145_c0_g1~~TRINITY_DN2145_c0_g1_i1.p2  ORF type:complete len:102 (+),score=38.20 TRINITY_DN2145_c0_g1_i1:264-569(+)